MCAVLNSTPIFPPPHAAKANSISTVTNNSAIFFAILKILPCFY